MNSTYKLLPIDCLQRGQYQVRTHFDQNALQELAQSIQEQGLIEPLIVRSINEQRYEIIAGERRWRAAMLAGLTTVPCLIGNYSDKQTAALTLVENIQRQELNLIEEAKGYHRLILEFNFQQDEIATLVGKSRSHIANILRLLTLSKEVQEHLIAGKLSLGHARLLVGMPTAQQHLLAIQAIDHEWSVRVLEKKVKALKSQSLEQPLAAKNKDIERLEMILAEQLGSPVQILNDADSAGGWLQVKYFNNDTLAGLLERLGLRYD